MDPSQQYSAGQQYSTGQEPSGMSSVDVGISECQDGVTLTYGTSESTGELDHQSYLGQLTGEQRAKLEEEWRSELVKTEDEIQTLRQVLAARVKHAQDLKKKLGIGAWQELTNDLASGIKTVQETTASGLGIFNTPYQKTSETVKFAAEKTTDIFGSLGDSISKRLGDVKNSSAFKSFEERVGSAVGKTGSTTTGGVQSGATPGGNDQNQSQQAT